MSKRIDLRTALAASGLALLLAAGPALAQPADNPGRGQGQEQRKGPPASRSRNSSRRPGKLASVARSPTASVVTMTIVTVSAATTTSVATAMTAVTTANAAITMTAATIATGTGRSSTSVTCVASSGNAATGFARMSVRVCRPAFA